MRLRSSISVGLTDRFCFPLKVPEYALDLGSHWPLAAMVSPSTSLRFESNTAEGAIWWDSVPESSVVPSLTYFSAKTPTWCRLAIKSYSTGTDL